MRKHNSVILLRMEMRQLQEAMATIKAYDFKIDVTPIFKEILKIEKLINQQASEPK